MKKIKSKSSADLHKQIEVRYKNWILKKQNIFGQTWAWTVQDQDQDGVGYLRIYRDFSTIEEAIEYIDQYSGIFTWQLEGIKSRDNI